MSEQLAVTLTLGQSLSVRHDLCAPYWIAYQVESFRNTDGEIEILLANPENREDTVIVRVAKPHDVTH